MLSYSAFIRCRLLPVACAAALYCGAASAEISDTIHPFVAIGYTYDDNLLRLADDVPDLIQKSDRMTQSQAGLLVDRPFGRQRLTATAKVSRVTFDHYEQFNYNGKDIKADLAWELGNRFSGNLGGNYIETLTPFSDYNTTQRNLRKSRREYVNGAWKLHPSWQVRAGYIRNKYEYELLAQRVNDRNENVAEIGADYLAASGSRIGVLARQLKGEYVNPRTFFNIPLDSDYTQDELKANINWRFSGVTYIQVLAGYARRKYEGSSSRDSSGANGRATVTWAPLGKVKFTGELWREFAAVESVVVSNSLNKGASIGAAWDISAKVQANANVRHETRQFQQLSTSTFTGDTSDKLNSMQLGLTYAPTLGSQLGVTAFREKRNGSPIAGTNDYRANGVSINASVQF
jgi:exopolysaccharide biosynthesis operon protein EpsL